MNTPENDDSGEIVTWTPDDMVEISLVEPDDFLRVKETLTRIGRSIRKLHNTLRQTCHILHKQGRYFIVHHKELFMLDGVNVNFTMKDLRERNTIIKLLGDWGMIASVNPTRIAEQSDMSNIKVIPFRVKRDWSLKPVYVMGKRQAAA